MLAILPLGPNLVAHARRKRPRRFDMVKNTGRSGILVATALLLGIAPLAAQRPGADSSAPPAQGYAPSAEPEVGPRPPDIAAANPAAAAGAIVLPARSEAAIEQAI